MSVRARRALGPGPNGSFGRGRSTALRPPTLRPVAARMTSATSGRRERDSGDDRPSTRDRAASPGTRRRAAARTGSPTWNDEDEQARRQQEAVRRAASGPAERGCGWRTRARPARRRAWCRRASGRAPATRRGSSISDECGHRAEAAGQRDPRQQRACEQRSTARTRWAGHRIRAPPARARRRPTSTGR